MSEFQVYSIDAKIGVLSAKLTSLNSAIEKITKNSKCLQVSSLERVNRVALFNVKIKHTSEYLLKLGSEFYAKVKTESALEILSERKKNVEEEKTKWIKLKQEILEREERKKKLEKDGRNMGRNGLESVVENLGENQQGQEIFNIVEFGEPEALKREINIFNEKGIKGEQQQPTQPIIQEQEPPKKEQKKEYKNIEVAEAPKKLSKFKMERMKMKEKEK